MRRDFRQIPAKVKITNWNTLFDLDSDAVADVEALLRLDIGDTGRLDHIKSMLQNGKDLYDSDRKYLESLKSRISGNVSKHDIQNHDHVKTDKTPSDEPSRQGPETDPSPAIHAQAPQDPIPSDASRDKNIVIINQPRQSSAAWYLLPIFFSIIGGAISYFCLRKQDPPRARKTLILGAVLSVMPILLLASLLGSVYYEFEGSRVSVTDMTDDQIKQSAPTIPHASLMEESERYKGEIIHYEGDIEQVLNNFNSYVLRVQVSDQPFATDSIWSNFDPNTDKERQWVEELEKTLNPFSQDPDSVKIWGIFTGLREHDTIFGNTMTIPEVDVYILEKTQP